MNQALLDELNQLLRFPSVSTGEANIDGLRDAAAWINEYINARGGKSEVVETKHNPLVVGEFASANPDSPTVLIYGHYDVQATGNADAWITPPFEPTVRDGRLFARGASDDKGNFWPLLYVAAQMATAGELPVNIRVLVEGDEEVGSASAIEWILQSLPDADCCIIFDSGSPDQKIPAITLGTRGMIQAKIKVTTGARDLHSGIYGGSVFNANHVLAAMLGAVLPGPDGILRDELRAGITPIPEKEREVWKILPRAKDLFAAAGARPLTERSEETYYAQNWGDTSLEVNSISGGEPRTVIPATAKAHVTMRLAPGQRQGTIVNQLTRLLRAAAPAAVDVEIETEGVDAAAFDSEDPALVIARKAFEKVCGTEPLLIRLGATLPLLAPLASRGIPTILAGFAVEDDAVHAPNESYRLEALDLGAATARQLYVGLAELPVK